MLDAFRDIQYCSPDKMVVDADKATGSSQFILDLLQFQEGLYRGKAIDVRSLKQLPDALKGLGMRVENGKLHLWRHNHFKRLVYCRSNMLLFELAKDLFGPFDQRVWHPCHLCDVDAEAMGAATGRELTKEDDLVPNFLVGDMKVPDPGKLILQLVQLVIVCGKECQGPMR